MKWSKVKALQNFGASIEQNEMERSKSIEIFWCKYRTK